MRDINSYFKNGYKPMMDREETWSEQQLTSKIAEYMRTYHPTIPFQVDLSGEKLSKAAASRSSKSRAEMYKQPDLTIYVKKGKFGTLMLELKKLSTHPLRKDGKLKKSEHLEIQASSIEWLRKYGQCADFGVGYKDTIEKINKYLTDGEINYLYK